MAAARDEFMELGFEKASMRSIAERCGMTAAGLYRHCRDKEDLFDQIAGPAVERISSWINGHVERYSKLIRGEESGGWQDSWVDMMREVIYPHMDEYHLLIAGSRGSRYRDFLHEMTEKSQKQFWDYLPQIRNAGYKVRDISQNELHLLLSAYITALFEPVVHNYSQQEALACLDSVEAFFLPGWKNLLGF